jgi:ABC-type ATPase with predicted acetyltransferase domain
VTEPARVRSVRAVFGLPPAASDGPERARALRRRADNAASLIINTLQHGQIALVTGPSGAGKSLVLHAIQRATPCVVALPIDPDQRRTPVELIGGTLPSALAALAAVGLADARRLVTQARRLSEGEKARLALALALANAQRGPGLLLADEFLAPLDRHTARSAARSLRRAIPPSVRLVCATARDEILDDLAPDILLYVPFEAEPEIHRREAN